MTIINKRSVLIIITVVTFFAVDIIVSLWLFNPTFKSKLLQLYYSFRYPFIPQSEFVIGKKFNFLSSEQNIYYKYRGDTVEEDGVRVLIKKSDGTEKEIFRGKVIPLSATDWEREIGATLSANLSEYERAVNIKSGKIALSYQNLEKIINFSRNATVKRSNIYKDGKTYYGNVPVFIPASLEDIKIDDFIMYEKNDNTIKIYSIPYK